jgi:hypothetical protein
VGDEFARESLDSIEQVRPEFDESCADGVISQHLELSQFLPRTAEI